MQGKLVSHLEIRQGMLSGTVTNRLSIALSDVYVLMARMLVRVGDLGPGQTRQIKLTLPLPPANGDRLPACGSLAQQLGIQVPNILATYDHFFLGGSSAAPSSSPQASLSMPSNERQRHADLLTFMFASLRCSHPPLVATGPSATLIGWMDQTQGVAHDLLINGLHPSGQHETLLLSHLDVSYATGVLVLSPDMLPGSFVDVQAVSMRRVSPMSYALAKGHATFEYTLPASSHLSAQTISLSQPVDNFLPFTDDLTLPHTHVELYNWQTATWDIIPLTQVAPFTTTNADAYLSADGRLLVQYVNQQHGLADITFARPFLTITGNVVA
jgi:hypothetical protein